MWVATEEHQPQVCNLTFASDNSLYFVNHRRRGTGESVPLIGAFNNKILKLHEGLFPQRRKFFSVLLAHQETTANRDRYEDRRLEDVKPVHFFRWLTLQVIQREFHRLTALRLVR